MINALLVACGGGFTTFSSFAAESTDLMKSGHTVLALCYIYASIIIGVVAVFAGEKISL
ncbi:fluoride efflux transporter FluC [Catenisphaera adipataccumulans]|jgi:CrcB protein|uniref:Fluoride-specific ion channel n=1 Tax=Catenisphaera adipataccumulans TaxID=700500 RepID=A0A7W8CVD3_9FIRM|nr:CrcB family protein [Catenisphaera adipataccumulans]MBB5182301.1 fluoride ion exporter CrcB/FEX [Catenisphaera adipataccumulans]